MTVMIKVTAAPAAPKAPTLTSVLKRHGKALDDALVRGYNDGRAGRRQDERIKAIVVAVRVLFGFKARFAKMLTPPDSNIKLDKAKMVTFGLTLAHATLSAWNLCPWAGDCTKVCVLNNGNGRYSSVQRAWLWRTHFLAEHPEEAMYQIGYELGRAVRKHGAILFRPNVNSDVLWHVIAPSLGLLDGVNVYGYTKAPLAMLDMALLDAIGMHVAYSFNERSKMARVREHLANGGKVALVTNRKPTAPIDPDAVRLWLGVPDVPVVDADLTDEWMLADGAVVGDLSAKGDARGLIGVSDFIAVCY
jgi:hypothetical protein